MTKSVTDQNSQLLAKNRQHTDSPGFWIAAVTGSLALHLFVFWLIGLYSNQLSLLQQQNSSSAIPIEVVEVPAQRSSKVKPQTKPSLNTQASSTVDEDGIDLIDQKIAIASKRNSPTQRRPQHSQKLTVEQKIEPKTTLQPQQTTEPAPTFKYPPTPPPDSSEDQPPTTNNQQSTTNNQPLDEQQKLQLPEQPGGNISLGKSTPLPNVDLPVQPPPQLPPEQNPTGGGIVASWDAFSREEIIDFIRKGVIRQDIPPEIPAQPLGNNTKNLPISFLSSEPDLTDVKMIASLAIDEQGKLIAHDANGNPGVEIIDIDTDTDISAEELATKKSKYQQFLINVFQDVSFNPGKNIDGSKPPQSNLVVRLKIERR